MPEVIEERYFTYVNGGAGSNNNKFYRYQLLADGTILTQWGRIGETPSNGRKTGGKTALERLIRERTGKKGYKEQEIIGSTLSAGAPAIQKEKLERIAATALVADGSASAPVSALIHRLVDLNKHEIVEASGGKIEVDTDGVVKTALGIVSQNTIARARTVLGNLTSDPTNTTLVDQYTSADEWGNMTAIGSVLDMTAREVGTFLRDQGLAEKSEPTEHAVSIGAAKWFTRRRDKVQYPRWNVAMISDLIRASRG